MEMKRKKERLSWRSLSPEPSDGPLLSGLLAVHRMNEEALEMPRLGYLATALSARCRDLGSPAIWPVGDAAARLAGAAVLVAEGDVKVRGWVDDVREAPILLVSLAAATSLEMIEAATHARALGVSAVHACGWNVADLDSPELEGVFESRFTLDLAPVGTPLRLAG